MPLMCPESSAECHFKAAVHAVFPPKETLLNSLAALTMCCWSLCVTIIKSGQEGQVYSQTLVTQSKLLRVSAHMNISGKNNTLEQNILQKPLCVI